MRDTRAEVLYNREIGPGYFKMGLACSGIAREAKAGQFVQIKCSDESDPLLRRPFSIHRLIRSAKRVTGAEILYEVVGRGTEILSGKKRGGLIRLLGPLGKGFTLPRAGSTAILVGGGIGVAPLFFLADYMAGKTINTVVLIGAKTRRLVLCEKDFKKTGAEVQVSTEDGSRGYKGVVTGPLRRILRRTEAVVVYACGPRPMLRSVAKTSEEKGAPCQISLEEKMACGIGACLGCAVKVRDTERKRGVVHKLACKDGPVFDAEEMMWD